MVTAIVVAGVIPMVEHLVKGEMVINIRDMAIITEITIDMMIVGGMVTIIKAHPLPRMEGIIIDTIPTHHMNQKMEMGGTGINKIEEEGMNENALHLHCQLKLLLSSIQLYIRNGPNQMNHLPFH